MTVQEAWSIVGNQPKSAIKNMVKALSMMKALNTSEENRRLEAGKICLKTTKMSSMKDEVALVNKLDSNLDQLRREISRLETHFNNQLTY